MWIKAIYCVKYINQINDDLNFNDKKESNYINVNSYEIQPQVHFDFEEIKINYTTIYLYWEFGTCNKNDDINK